MRLCRGLFADHYRTLGSVYCTLRVPETDLSKADGPLSHIYTTLRVSTARRHTFPDRARRNGR